MSKKLEKSFVYKAVHITVLMLYNLLLIPVLLKFWDLQVYGAWIALYVVFNLLQVFELGHSTYVGNEINRIVHEDKDKAQYILGSAVRANFVVSGLQPLIVWIIYKLGLLSFFLDDNIDQQEVINVLLILFAYRLLIGSARSLIQKVLNPFGLIYKFFQYSILETILEFVVLVVAAFTKISLLELALLWFIVKFVYSIFVLIDLKRVLPLFFPWWRTGDFKRGFKDMYVSFSYAASNFLDRLGNDGIVLLVSAFMGTTFLPLFTATRTIVNFGLKLSDFFLTPLAPEMINLYSKAKTGLIENIIKAYWFVSSAILITGFVGSLFVIEWLFGIWTKGKLEFSMELYCFLAFIFLVKNYGKVLVVFFTSINKTRIVLITTLIRIFVIYAFAFAFMQWKIDAILWAMLLAEVAVVTFWLPVFSIRIFNIHGFNRLKFFVNLIIALLVGLFFYLYINSNELLSILTLAVILLLLYNQYIMISKSLRDNIKDRLLRTLRIVKV